METDIFAGIRKLSNQELIAQVQLLAKREREATAALIAHLVVLDERGLHLAEGCSSLFTYCTEALHLSVHAAYGRVEVAHAARTYPVILKMLSDGVVNLTTIALLVPELTHANHRELLEAARHKSKREIQELIAALRPRPPVPSMIRKLPERRLEPERDAMPPVEAPLVQAASAAPSAAQTPARPVIVPLAPQRYKVQFTASQRLRTKLEHAQALLRHRIPDGDLAQIIELAVTELIKTLEKKKLGAISKPRVASGATSESRHIPAEIKRHIWARDSGRCAFVAHSGRRCTERGFLEFHHVVPYSAGGKATLDNVELRCRAHNGYETEVYFGTPHAEPEFKTMRKLGL